MQLSSAARPIERATRPQSIPGAWTFFGASPTGLVGYAGSWLLHQLRGHRAVTNDQMPSLLLMIEGNIGCGKTTLARTMAERMPNDFEASIEEVGDLFLEAFHREPGRYGFPLQMVQQLRRQANLQRQSTAAAAAPMRLIDRSVVGDYAFALWNRALGNLNAVDWQLYIEQAGPIEHLVPSDGQHLVVWLNDDAASCLLRRRRRDSSVPANADAYMHGLEVTHMLVLARLPDSVPVAEWQWREYARQSSDKDIQRLAERFRSIRGRPPELPQRARQALDALECDAHVKGFLVEWFGDCVKA
jgi:deoxyadenosine/deoxycytidine kinase